MGRERFARIGAVLAAVIALGGCASLGGMTGTRTLDRIAASKEIVLGHREAAVPFSFDTGEKEPSGYSVDLCKRVVDGLARQLKVDRIAIRWVRVGPPDARVSAVADRRVDMECGVTTVTLTRLQSVDFSSPIFVDGAGLLILTSSPLARGANIASRRVGVIAGTTTEAALRATPRRAGIDATIVPVQDHADGVRAVNDGRIDAYSADRTVLLGVALASRNRDNLAVSDEQLSFEPFALVVPRDDPDFRLAVNRQLAGIFASEEIQKVYGRWLAPLGEPGMMTLATFRMGALPE